MRHPCSAQGSPWDLGSGCSPAAAAALQQTQAWVDVVFLFFFLGVSLDASCVLKMAGVERERKEERGRQGDGSGGSSWAQLLAEASRFLHACSFPKCS